jgi:hypothetical protein
LLVCGVVATTSACSRRDAAADTSSRPRAAPAAAPSTAQPPAAHTAHDLSADEALGGHTLARHVGRTDADLAERLEHESISAASTYTDRGAAERAVGAALDANDRKVASWEHRTGRRPNLVLHYVDRSGVPLGRSLFRGQSATVPCDRALVVIRWDDRHGRAYVLTSYPDCNR